MSVRRRQLAPSHIAITTCVFAMLGGFACSSPGGAAPPPELDPTEQLPGGAATNRLLLGANAFTMPAGNLSADHESLFFAGNSFFNQNWVQAPASTTARDGLGPLFNARSCAGCHFKDGRGRPPLEAGEAFSGLLLRLGIPGSDEHGGPLPEPNYGSQLQPFAIAGVPAEGVPSVEYRVVPGEYGDGERYELLAPSYAIEPGQGVPLAADTLISPRVAPAMIGLGLLEAIPRERLEALSDPDDQNGDGISGRINLVYDLTLQTTTVGRFGWKAEQPSVLQQSAGAFAGDLGLTSSLFPISDCTASEPACAEAPNGGEPEVDDATLARVELYSRVLAVPVRTSWKDEQVLTGRALFFEAGCAGCHVPTHTTAASAPIPEASAQRIWPYTDLLLHDMGPGLSDERPVFSAEGSEWRTPPLWGLRFYAVVNGHDRLLHDGRARGVAEAILWHDGEAAEAREAFRSLPKAQRALLIGFVESL
jgi:CxxC motif-containing protein (DUF1111 family)